ncbi:MAG: hypothetical protein OWQ52_00650 [Metallosphaera prunae]|uniref:hypothetical protein n=1 Tax=Metallosphaera prunae TaxID=47304 RepID=UPI002274DF37|nr:hypothetical protein [Metallosphaera prunae]MCY0860924.1 hypothetical protein [Metallosphaera prunae]
MKWAPIVQFVLSILVSFLGYWYLLAVVAIVLGVVSGGVRSLYQGLASVLGVLIVALSNSGGLAQSYIFANIAGLPSLTPFLLTAVLAFVLGMLGYIFGDSLRRS